jgi:hypothetical protein
MSFLSQKWWFQRIIHKKIRELNVNIELFNEKIVLCEDSLLFKYLANFARCFVCVWNLVSGYNWSIYRPIREEVWMRSAWREFVHERKWPVWSSLLALGFKQINRVRYWLSEFGTNNLREEMVWVLYTQVRS